MNLFFLSTPFQIINAREAMQHYGCKDNIAVVLEANSKEAQAAIDRQLKNLELRDVIYLSQKSDSSLKPRLVKALDQIKKINNSMIFDNVFYSEYPSRRVATILGNVTITGKEVMFDDGTWTLKAYEEHLRDNVSVSYHGFKRDFILKLFGYKKPLDFQIRSNFELFTFFDLPVSNFPIAKNSFEILRKSIENLRLARQDSGLKNYNAIFIGDGGTEIGLNIDKYCDQLCLLAKTSEGLLYFPHRNESGEVKNRLKQIKNLEYADSNGLPIELALSNYNFNAIYGYYSTALFTLPKVYPDIPVYAKKLTCEEFNNAKYLENLSKLIDKYLSTQNINTWV